MINIPKRNGYSELLTQFGCDVQIGATTTSLSERLGDLHARRRLQQHVIRTWIMLFVRITNYMILF
jgi:hypothetical protein